VTSLAHMRFSYKHICCAILVFLLLSQNLFPQQSELSKGVNYISEFIASDYFKDLSKTNSDLALADTIYLRAVHYKNYDYSEALLGLTFACVPYRKVPVRLPLLNIVLYYPLTSAGRGTYLKKNMNLPRNLYFDTPTNSFGDKDKLAHFFGSAYISYSSKVFDFGNLIGYFVESFEDEFKVQSRIDTRDMMTNRLGNLFGKILKENKNILPSQVFILRTFQYLIIL